MADIWDFLQAGGLTGLWIGIGIGVLVTGLVGLLMASGGDW